MTDLSKIPDLELRQRSKSLSDQIEAVDNRIADIKRGYLDKMKEATQSLEAERAELDEQLGDIIGDREIIGTCSQTGLPIFDGDDVVETLTLEAAA